MAELLSRARPAGARSGRGGGAVREKIPPGLPTGEGVRRALAGFFREQKRLALGDVGRLLAEAKAEGPWDEEGLGADELAERLLPALGAIWDASGEGEAERADAVRARFGLPPVGWRPADPDIAEAIAAHARTLARNIQGVTEGQVAEALRAGSDDGESPEQLRDRLVALFRGAETARAERIARTEAIRAHNAAANLAATRSGVVAGWEWVAGGDACSLCREIAARCRYQRLGQPFAVVGGHADYASVPHPPAHPHCACTLAPVLMPEYGGPEDVAWGEAVEQAGEELSPSGWFPRRRKKPAATPPPIPPSAPPPIPPPAPISPMTGQRAPILPGHPIKDRLDAYIEGDHKVQALQKLDSGDAEELGEAIIEIERLEEKIYLLRKEEKNPQTSAMRKLIIQADISILAKDLSIERQKRADLRKKIPRAKILALLASNQPLKINHQQVNQGPTNPQLDPLNPAQSKRLKLALTWISRLLETNGSPQPLEVKVGSLVPQKPGRSGHSRGVIAFRVDVETRKIVHELGHFIDTMDAIYGSPQAGKVVDTSIAYLNYRVGNETAVPLNSIVGGNLYRPSEKGRKDDFDRYFSKHFAYYCGKEYSHSATEILAMGLQTLYDDPVGFAIKDPEYCKFVLGILDGSLR